MGQFDQAKHAQNGHSLTTLLSDTSVVAPTSNSPASHTDLLSALAFRSSPPLRILHGSSSDPSLGAENATRTHVRVRMSSLPYYQGSPP